MADDAMDTPGAERSEPDERVEPSESAAELGSDVRRSLRWSVASQLAVRVVNVGSGVVLLRILVPAEYGVYVFALAVIAILMSFNDLGQVLTIVRWPDDDVQPAARTSTTMTWANSVACFVVCFVSAPLLAQVTNRPEATGVVRLMSVLILIDGFGTVPRALLFRTFRHAATAKADLYGTVVNVALSIGFALLGFGAWAPAFGTVGAAFVTGGLVLRAAPSIPRPGWDRAIARRLLSFGFPLALATLVELTLLNVDYLVIARELGATALGLYAVAFNVSSWPSTLLTQAIRKVSVAGFSQVEGGAQELAASFSRNFALLATLLLPVCVGLGVLAEPLLRLLYTEEIAQAATALSWLVVLGGIRVSLGLVFDLLLSQGRSRATARLQFLWLLAAAPSLYFGARWCGIAGVAAAHTFVAIGVAVPLHLASIKSMGVRAGLLGAGLVRPFVAASCAIAAGVVLARIVSPPFLTILAAGTAIVVVYLALVMSPRELLGLARNAR